MDNDQLNDQPKKDDAHGYAQYQMMSKKEEYAGNQGFEQETPYDVEDNVVESVEQE